VSKPGCRPNGDLLSLPTPREIRALKALSDGATFTQAAETLGIPRGTLADAMSRLYARLGLQHQPSQYRRQLAVMIGRREGWWPQ